MVNAPYLALETMAADRRADLRRAAGVRRSRRQADEVVRTATPSVSSAHLRATARLRLGGRSFGLGRI